MDDSSDETTQPGKQERMATKKELDDDFKRLHGMLLGQWEVITFLLEYLADRGKLSVPDLQRYLEEALQSERAENLTEPILAALTDLRAVLRGLPGAVGDAPH